MSVFWPRAPLAKIMKPVEGYFLIKPEDLHWRPSNLMKIPNADFLERTKSENLGARLWRYAPNTARTLHKHIRAPGILLRLGRGRPDACWRADPDCAEVRRNAYRPEPTPPGI